MTCKRGSQRGVHEIAAAPPRSARRRAIRPGPGRFHLAHPKVERPASRPPRQRCPPNRLRLRRGQRDDAPLGPGPGRVHLRRASRSRGRRRTRRVSGDLQIGCGSAAVSATTRHGPGTGNHSLPDLEVAGSHRTRPVRGVRENVCGSRAVERHDRAIRLWTGEGWPPIHRPRMMMHTDKTNLSYLRSSAFICGIKTGGGTCS